MYNCTSIDSNDSSPESKGYSVCGGDIDDPVKEEVVSLWVWYQVALVIQWLEERNRQREKKE